MAFLAPLLSAGMSSGILPSLGRSIGDFAQTLVSGIGSGRPFLETLGNAATKGLSSLFGGDSSAQSPMQAVAPSRHRSAANARPIVVPDSLGARRIVQTRPLHVESLSGDHDRRRSERHERRRLERQWQEREERRREREGRKREQKKYHDYYKK